MTVSDDHETSESSKSEKDVDRIRDAALKRALNTPHKPHVPLKKSAKVAAPKGKAKRSKEKR